MGADIIDMELNMVADSKFRAKTMEIKLVFDSADPLNTPVFEMISEYSKFDEAEPNSEDIAPKEYTEVEDVRVLKKVDNAIKKIQNAASGKVILEIKQNIRLMDESDNYSEKDVISYGTQNGSYYYDITADSDGQKVIISYKGGVQTVTSGSETQSGSQSEEVAKGFINGLINTANYKPSYVSNVEKTSDGVYKLTMGNHDASVYKEYFEGFGAEVESVTQETVVTMSDDSIVKIEDLVVICGTYKVLGNSEEIVMTVKSTMTVEDISKPDIEL